jgi:hypothetical protein
VDAVTGEYELNVGRFIKDFPDWTIAAGTSGTGYTAQRRDGYSHGRGQRYDALTLDDLAEQLKQAESRRSRPERM